MRILWITNLLFPEAIGKLTGRDTTLQSSGGWLIGYADSLIQEDQVELYVAAPCSLVDKLTKITGAKITYYALPCRNERKYNPTFEQMWRSITQEVGPQLVHIHGTEFSHGLAFCRAKVQVPHLLSIQGISELIGYHYLDGLSRKDVYNNTSFFDFFVVGNLFKQQKKFIKHGITVEREIIRSSRHIIGRTMFDRAYVSMLNPTVEYHKCNESLRSVFYKAPFWNYDSCQKHTIFLSQSGNPIKGLHQVLKAMPYVLQRFPDAEIRIAGKDIISKETMRQKMMRSSYANYVDRLIKQFRLNDQVHFTGPLDAEQMKQEYLNCNVFICASSIENSSNSLGEAQVLGVPCIASYVGGTPDMIPNEACGQLYRFSDYFILAEAICRAFTNDFNPEVERETALIRHDLEANKKTLLKIYHQIIDKG